MYIYKMLSGRCAGAQMLLMNVAQWNARICHKASDITSTKQLVSCFTVKAPSITSWHRQSQYACVVLRMIHGEIMKCIFELEVLFYTYLLFHLSVQAKKKHINLLMVTLSKNLTTI